MIISGKHEKGGPGMDNKRKREQKNKRGDEGFTLIEIMVVVMIIGMLATVVGVKVMGYIPTAKRNTAKAQISNFKSALDKYYLDNSHYPTTEQGLMSLVNEPSSHPQPKNWDKNGYLDSIPVDPWGNEYIYFSPSVDSRGAYSIECYGGDGLKGGDDENMDIVSWDLGAN
jgi:general secretion pathway protein G